MGNLHIQTNKKKTCLLTKWQRQKEEKKWYTKYIQLRVSVDDPPCRARCTPFALLQVGESWSERGTEARAQSFFSPIALSQCTLLPLYAIPVLLSQMQQYMNQTQKSHCGKFFISQVAMLYPCLKQDRLTR